MDLFCYIKVYLNLNELGFYVECPRKDNWSFGEFSLVEAISYQINQLML
jgi:hypothetical protein